MINLQPLVKSGISYLKSEQSRVLKVLQTMAMVDVRSMKNVRMVDIMPQYSIIGILHALVSSHAVCKQILHMILTSAGEKLNDLQKIQ